MASIDIRVAIINQIKGEEILPNYEMAILHKQITVHEPKAKKSASNWKLGQTSQKVEAV